VWRNTAHHSYYPHRNTVGMSLAASPQSCQSPASVVVVGGGLAGLAATIEAVEQGEALTCTQHDIPLDMTPTITHSRSTQCARGRPPEGSLPVPVTAAPHLGGDRP
jgi:hypothetical protein